MNPGIPFADPVRRPGLPRRLAAALAPGFRAPLLSGLLLALSFPPVGWSPLAWVALVPFVAAAPAPGWRAALGRGWWLGFWFFFLSLFWLMRVTAAGWFVLATACALYWLPFAAFVHWWRTRLGAHSIGRNLGAALLGAVVWCGLETARAHWFTGFGWNSLGVSQHAVLPVIQVAEWGGVHAVSFLVVLVNLGAAGAWLRYRAEEGRRLRWGHLELTATAAVVLAASLWGFARLAAVDARASTRFKAVAIQPNIPQYEKWTSEFARRNYRILTRLTHGAITAHPDADLLLWPETAIPDDGSLGPEVREWLTSITGRGVPLLAGALQFRNGAAGIEWVNAAILVDTNGQFAASYEKQHLVMFGEYVPGVFKVLLPFLQKMTAVGDDVTAGTQATVFAPRGEPVFSVTICFEDTVPDLSRDFVRRGARLLVNQTNDGWFDPFRGSEQHLANAVFRSMENRVPTLRCTNTGVSAAIDATGRVHSALRDPGTGRADIEGFVPLVAALPAAGFPQTFYTRHGDVFGYTCLGLTFACLIAVGIRRRADA